MERRHNWIFGVLVATVAGLIAWRLFATRQRADRAESRVTEARDEGRFRAVAEGRAIIETARYALEVDPAESLALLSKVIDAGNNPDDLGDIRTIAADAASRGYAHRIAGKTRVHGISVSRDGFLLAVAGDDSKVHVWLLSGERTEQTTLVGHERAVLDVAFVGERTLVSIDAAGEVRRWNLEAGDHGGVVVRSATGLYRRAVLSPAGERAVLFGDRDAELVVLQQGGAERLLTGCTQAAWSRDGSLAYADKTTIHVVSPTGTETKLAAPPGVTSLALHTDVFVGFADGSVRRFGPRPERTDVVGHRHAGPVTALAIAAGGDLVSASSDLEGEQPLEGDHLVIATREQPFRLRGHAAPIDALAASSGAIVSAGRDGELRAWVLPPAPKRHQWTGQGKLSHAAIAADGKAVALAHSGPAIDMLRLDGDQQPQYSLPLDHGTDLGATRTEIGGEKIERAKSAIRTFVASSDGRRIATLDDSFRVIAWDGGGGHAVGTGYVLIAQSADGERIAGIRRDAMIKVWRRGGNEVDVQNLEMLGAIAIDATGNIALAYASGKLGLIETTGTVWHSHAPDRESRIRALAFAGRQVIAGGDDGLVNVWDPPTNTLVSWPGHGAPIRAIALGPKGDAATIDASGTFLTWDLAHIVEPMPQQPHRGHAGAVSTVAFGSDLASAGDDRTVRVWSAGGSRVVARHPARVLAVAVVGGVVISVDENGTVLETPDVMPRDRDGLRVWLGNR